MITPDHIRTANGILVLVGLGKFPESKAAAALIAVHLANLPPEPEMWGATPEPMSSEDHMRDAVLSACRVVKAVGWVLDAMSVAILATAEVGSAYAAWTRPTVDVHVWCAKMSEGLADKLRDLAGVATVATEEPEAAPVVHTHECYTRSAMAEHWQCDCSGTLAIYSKAPAIDTTVPDETATSTPPIVGHVVDVVSVEDPDVPAPKKPRCGRVYGHKESMPPIPMVCTRPEGHKGACGEAKVVGKAKAASAE